MKHIRKPTIKILLVIVLLSTGTACAEELIIRHIRPVSDLDQRNGYFIDMLRLALEKTEETDGPFSLVMTKRPMLQSRAIASLQKKKAVDVVWTMTSLERENRLLPVRIPLLKGLLGHRVFIINRRDQAKFATVKTFDDLKAFRAGQGHDWPDTDILRANGIEVVTTASYDGLFEMLEKGRFDYFPRGVNEPWAEVRTHADKDLIVETRMLLQYPAPIYFFVNQDNTHLAKRLERGLRLAISDGSFDTLFFNHPMTRDIFEQAQLDTRIIFTLNNPLLPPETPLEEKALWYAP